MTKKKRSKIPVELLHWETYNGKTCIPKCWCRGIRTISKNSKHRDVVPYSFLTKKQAELIVKIHNEWLWSMIHDEPINKYEDI